MVIEAESLEAANAMFMADPFITEGIFGTYEMQAAGDWPSTTWPTRGSDGLLADEIRA